MTVYQPGEVDRISAKDNDREAFLTIFIPGPIVNDQSLVQALEAKLQAYVRYVESGKFAADYPSYASYRVYIELAHIGALGTWGKALFGSLSKKFADRGIGLATIDIKASSDEG